MLIFSSKIFQTTFLIVAIDTEFTGLHVDSTKPRLTDTADQRYKKLRKSVQTYNVIQIGLCAFRYCSEQKM